MITLEVNKDPFLTKVKRAWDIAKDDGVDINKNYLYYSLSQDSFISCNKKPSNDDVYFAYELEFVNTVSELDTSINLVIKKAYRAMLEEDPLEISKLYIYQFIDISSLSLEDQYKAFMNSIFIVELHIFILLNSFLQDNLVKNDPRSEDYFKKRLLEELDANTLTEHNYNRVIDKINEIKEDTN